MPTNSTARTISELLNVLATTGTYQGLTDEEIQLIVDYEKNRSFIEGQSTTFQTNAQSYHAAALAQNAASLQSQEIMLQSIIDRASNPQYVVMQHG